MKTIKSSEANRYFSRMLREVAQGEAYTILSRGRVVATVIPASSSAIQRRKAKSDLLKRLNSQPITGKREWTREELYD